MSAERRESYLRGQYEMCRLLLTSPRFNKPQREVIEHQAYAIKEALQDELGVEFEQEAARPPKNRAA